MALAEQITCDICGKQKQMTNHWWLVFIGTAQTGGYFSVYTWDATVDIKKFKHLCGQECLVKAVSEWMAEQGRQG